MSTCPTASPETIRARAAFLKAVRSFFDSRDFVEVQTPTLSRDTIFDPNLSPLTAIVQWEGMKETFYLQTSPEYAMKRLLAAGLDSIYQIAPAFRQSERGRLHNVEFTMLEWYDTRHDYRQGIDFLAELIGRFFDFPAEIVTFESLLQKHCRLDLTAGVGELCQFAQEAMIDFPQSFLDPQCAVTTSDWFDLIFSEKIQPTLGFISPVIVYNYPGEQAQLAQTQTTGCDGKSITIAKRYELFIRGIELANGYCELTDPSVLRQRQTEAMALRQQRGDPILPGGNRLLAAMEVGLPRSCGCALGIDRLLMILLDKQTIEEVIAFPIEIA